MNNNENVNTNGNNVNNNNNAVRPDLHLNLSFDSSWSYVGTVTSEGKVEEIETQKEEDLLLPCPGLPPEGDKEGIRGMEQYEEDKD